MGSLPLAAPCTPCPPTFPQPSDPPGRGTDGRWATLDVPSHTLWSGGSLRAANSPSAASGWGWPQTPPLPGDVRPPGRAGEEGAAFTRGCRCARAHASSSLALHKTSAQREIADRLRAGAALSTRGWPPSPAFPKIPLLCPEGLYF